MGSSGRLYLLAWPAPGAIARVAGETAPLLFTALGSRFLEESPNHPFPSLTVMIYERAMGPYREENRLAWAGILVLLLLIFALNVVVRLTAKAVAQRRHG